MFSAIDGYAPCQHPSFVTIKRPSTRQKRASSERARPILASCSFGRRSSPRVATGDRREGSAGPPGTARSNASSRPSVAAQTTTTLAFARGRHVQGRAARGLTHDWPTRRWVTRAHRAVVYRPNPAVDRDAHRRLSRNDRHHLLHQAAAVRVVVHARRDHHAARMSSRHDSTFRRGAELVHD
jgi:hypothetical protein